MVTAASERFTKLGEQMKRAQDDIGGAAHQHAPCTGWLDGVIARDVDGFILTGAKVGREDLLETSVPGVCAAGDVRAGFTKRCATAVGEGAMVVQFVHAHMAREGVQSSQ